MAGLGILGLIRAVAPGLESIVVVSAAIGACIGLVQSIPAAEVRVARLAPRVGSAAFTSGLIGSSIVATSLAVPLADLWGGWRGSLAILSLPALAAVLVWLRGTRPRPTDGIARLTTLPWRDRTAWLLAVAFGLQAAVYQCLMAWLPAMLVEDGWAEATAGACVALVNILALGSSLVLLFAGARAARGAGALLVAAGCVLAAMVLFAIGAPAVLGAIVAGASLGAVLPLLVGLAISHGRDATQAATVSAFMYLIGFGIAAIGPLALGVVRDHSTSFEAALWLLVVVATTLVVVVGRLWSASRQGSVDAPATA
jgi:CP family cyanate transporter-like MFS transporter